MYLIIKLKSCDLLENTYLCGSNNNQAIKSQMDELVVICLKIRTFVVAITTMTQKKRRMMQL